VHIARSRQAGLSLPPHRPLSGQRVPNPPDCVSGRRCGSGRDGGEPGRSVERSRWAGSHIRCRPCAWLRTICLLAGASPWCGS